MANSELKEKYIKEVMPELKKSLGIENDLAVPTVKKIRLNVGLGEAKTNPGSLEIVADVLGRITGQKALITKAKVSISNFKIRAGDKIGVAVTLRGDRMWDFLGKLIEVVLPRVRDFRGISPNAFDGKGNYSLGLKEYTVFPEVDMNKIDKIRGLGITIVTSSRSNEEGYELLKLLGMPFKKK